MTTYNEVNSAWGTPIDLPTMTMDDAMKYARRLTRKFGIKSAPWYGKRRRSWASTRVTRNEERHGWRELVHDVSHWVLRERHNGFLRTHSNVHAALELKMIEHVIAQGWTVPKLIERPTAEGRRALILQRTQEALKRWRTKQKRATTAIRKLVKKERRLLAA